MFNYKEADDKDLVIRFKNGDNRAFDEIYLRYNKKLNRLIYNYIYNSIDVEDVFHEVIIRVIRHIEKFNISMNFSSWIYQIAINCSKNFLKSRTKEEYLQNKEKLRIRMDYTKQENLEEDFIKEIDMIEFNNAIDSLDEKFRDVFLLRYDHKLKYSEIANILNCSERTAKWRMKRSIEKITSFLRDKGIV